MSAAVLAGDRMEATGSSEVSEPDIRRMDGQSVGLLTLGHCTVDLCQGLVPAMVSYVVLRENYTYFMGATLVFATAAMSSIVQPVFGQMADKLKLHWLLPVSVLTAGVALALGAQSPQYPILLIALAMSGFGIAAFHPEAARQTHLAAGDHRTTAMSFFSLGGSIGFALAPAVGSFALERGGRLGMLWVLIPTLLVTWLLALQFSRSSSPSRKRAAAQEVRARDDWFGFGVLSISVVARSIVFFAVNTFLVLYWRQRWGLPTEGILDAESKELVSPGLLQAGTIALSVFLGAGIAGTILGGWFADRVGRRAVLQAGFGLSLLTFPWMVWSPSPALSLVMVALTAALFFSPSSPAVVLGQEYLPNRVGMASGVTIGLAVSVGGMVVPLLGWLGDIYGLGVVFLIMEAMLAVCFLSTLLLPDPRISTREEPQPA